MKKTSDLIFIKEAVIDYLMESIMRGNDGVLSTYKSKNKSCSVMAWEKIKLEGDWVLRNEEPIYCIIRRYSKNGRELKPGLVLLTEEEKHYAKIVIRAGV